MSRSEAKYFHFTLGPVQGFVAQARRTRDFWAGSFILSWLSAIAMKEVESQGGKISFPAADGNFLSWLSGKGLGEKPTQGSVPNRFKAKVNDQFKPEWVIDAINAAWIGLADQIYKNDIEPLQLSKTKAIWDRQIKGFWEISWGITPDEADSSLLDRRKNWRSYYPPEEPGVKCMMMDGWQELSGTSSPHAKELKQFWTKLRDSQSNMGSDLNGNNEEATEWLSAIAFVKRRLTRYFHNISTEMPSGWVLKGWELPSSVPSVTYMAAIHWVEQALKGEEHSTYEKFYSAATNLVSDHPEWNAGIQSINRISARGKTYKRWVSIDGNLFFPTLLENSNLYPDQEKAQKTIKALADLKKDKELPMITPFYAVLMMDGDSLGKQMSNPDRQDHITNGLAKFTREVPIIVKRNNGFLIYAGGDDVLAILPLEDALDCAAEIRCCYESIFANTAVTTSLSGAIEYVHIKVPLSSILHKAHGLLDDIAKDKTGRDALAVRVWKPGGTPLIWSQPWEVVLKNDEIVLNKLAEQFQQADKEDNQFSSKFFYKIRERFTLLNPACDETTPVLDRVKASKLMAMEYLNSGASNIKSMKQAEETIGPLLEQCRPVYRQTEEDKPTKFLSDEKLLSDGALLVRFLAQKGVAQ